MSPANLAEAYIAAMPGTVVSIVASADGLRSRFETGAVDAGAIVHARLRFKDTHAELVLCACGVTGWADMPAAALFDLISTIARALGARPRSDADVEIEAKAAVAFVIEKVDGMRQNGGLAVVNGAYRRYRLGQVAKGEKSITYSAHLAAFTRSMVEKVARQRG